MCNYLNPSQQNGDLLISKTKFYRRELSKVSLWVYLIRNIIRIRILDSISPKCGRVPLLHLWMHFVVLLTKEGNYISMLLHFPSQITYLPGEFSKFLAENIADFCSDLRQKSNKIRKNAQVYSCKNCILWINVAILELSHD